MSFILFIIAIVLWLNDARAAAFLWLLFAYVAASMGA